MENYRKLGRSICIVFRWVMAALLFCMVALATVQVITRYVVAVTIIWVEELSIYLMNWMCAIGVAWIWMENCSHIKMDILDNMLPRKVLQGMDVVIDVVMAMVSVAVIRIGVKTRQVNRGMVMSVINLDEGDRYLPVIVGGALLLFATLYMMVEHIDRFRKKEGAEQ